MADIDKGQEAREFFETLNPYQVAVMAFTSPQQIDREASTETMTLTSKDSYVWAAAVAYLLVHRRMLNEADVLGYLARAFEQSGYSYARSAFHTLGSLDYAASGLPIVGSFLRTAGFDEAALRDACSLTEDAIRSLEWLGVIEDPIRKRILGILVAVYAIAGPVHFSSRGPNDWIYATPTSQVSVTEDSKTHQPQYEFNLKVFRIASVMKDAVLKGFEDVVGVAATVEEPPMSTKELQQRLTEIGLYHGPIDDKPWGQTYTALRAFQQKYHLKVTGYPDSETLRLLRETMGR